MDNRQTHSAFQNELQNILSELLMENLGRNTLYRRNQNQNQNTAFYILQSLRETMNAYNENIRQYGANTRLYLQILELIIRQELEQNQIRNPIIEPIHQPNSMPAPRRQRERTRDQPRPATPTQRQFLAYFTNPNLDSSGNRLRTFRHYDYNNYIIRERPFQNVIIRPSQQQIDSATRTIVYDSEMQLINHQCPIRLEEFENGQTIRQIIHCGHSFCEQSIQNWFQSSVRCPVCRYDIREQDVSGNSTEQSETDVTNRILDGLNTNITNIINNLMTNTEQENNDLVYTFDIPIFYNDLSGNFY